MEYKVIRSLLDELQDRTRMVNDIPEGTEGREEHVKKLIHSSKALTDLYRAFK